MTETRQGINGGRIIKIQLNYNSYNLLFIYYLPDDGRKSNVPLHNPRLPSLKRDNKRN